MAKKDRLARRAEKKAAQEIKMPTQADVDAQKQKALAEGAYTINPDSNRTLTSASDVIQTNKDVSSAIESGNVGKMGQFGISPKFTDEQIDAQIKIDAQKIAAADAKIEADAVIAKLEAGGDSQIVKAITQTKEELEAANSSVPDETIKEALGLNSPISPAIAAAVDKYETTGAITDPTTEDVRKYKEAIDSEDYYSMSPEEQRQLEAYSKLLNDPKTKVRKSEPALEKLGVQDYYPDMGEGIQEGSYSGSIVGSIPIYTAKGGVLPIGVFDARKRAVEAEAVKAKKTKADLIELAKVKTAPQYQQAADNLAFGILEKYLNMAGGDASVLMDMSNPIGMRAQKELNKVNNIKAEALWMEGRGQELLKAINNEQMYVPGEAKDALKKWLGGNYSLDELMNNQKALKEFHNIYNTLKINDNETYVIGKHIAEWEKAKKIEPMVADWNAQFTMLSPEKQSQLASVMKGRDYDQMLQLSMEYMPGSQLTDMIHGLYKTGEFTMGETELGAYAATWFGEKVVAKITTVANDNFKYAQLRQRASEQKAKTTFWENHALTTQSPETKDILGNAKNMTDEQIMNAIKATTNGLTTKIVNGKLVMSFKADDSEGNAEKVPIKSQKINGLTYNQFVENIPYKDNWSGIGKSVDWDKVKPEDVQMVRYVLSHSPDDIVTTHVTGHTIKYYTREQGNDKEVSIQDFKDDPSLKDRVFTKTDKHTGISAEVDIEDGYDDNGNKKYKTQTIGLGAGTRTYDLRNSSEINEMDNARKQGTVNIQYGENPVYATEFSQTSAPGGTVIGETETETTSGPTPSQ